jgi:FKBP-type peptidyl-prolyl cis-trans isomerase (trigger factor)
VFERDNYTCCYCGKRGGKLEVDHKIPVSKGGSDEIDNLATSCRLCNRQKKDKSIDEFKTSVRKTLEDKNAETQKNNKINAVYQAIKEGSKISSLPQSVTDFYTKQATDYYTELATKNKMDLDSFLQANNITKDQFNAKIADDTNAIASQELIIKSIAKAENLKLTDEEYQKGLADMAKDYGFDSNEEFTKKYGTEFVKEALMQEKVINFVADQAVEK